MTLEAPPRYQPPTVRQLRDRLRATATEQQKNPPRFYGPRPEPERPAGLVASARRQLAASSTDRKSERQGMQEWQAEAWEMYDFIGEERFLADNISNRMGQAALYVGELDAEASPGTRPEPTKNVQAQRILQVIGGGPAGLSQIISRSGVNLFVAGECWLVGIPPELMPGTPEFKAKAEAAKLQPVQAALPTVDREAADIVTDDLLRYVWRVFSIEEFVRDRDGKTVKLSMEDGSTVTTMLDAIYAIRTWRSHPKLASEANSPTRAVLPVLRELLGLTMHVAAQIDSRLAGAGILFISNKADVATKEAAGIPANSPESPVLDALIEAASTAIKNRADASALVPVVVSVPDDVVDKHKLLTFSAPLDKEAPKLRDEAIRRLALGQDAPPELLLGVADTNHWTAWLVREDVVKTHLEPPLAILCDALTEEWLRPLLVASGMTPDEAARFVVWFDTDHLIERPNRSADAKDLYAVNAISDKALREATGFEEGDAPDEPKITRSDPAVDLAMKLATGAPSLVQNPGLPTLVEQIRAVLDGPEATAAAAAEEQAVRDGESTAPDTDTTDGDDGGDPSAPGGIPDTNPADGGGQ